MHRRHQAAPAISTSAMPPGPGSESSRAIGPRMMKSNDEDAQDGKQRDPPDPGAPHRDPVLLGEPLPLGHPANHADDQGAAGHRKDEEEGDQLVVSAVVACRQLAGDDECDQDVGPVGDDSGQRERAGTPDGCPGRAMRRRSVGWRVQPQVPELRRPVP